MGPTDLLPLLMLLYGSTESRVMVMARLFALSLRSYAGKIQRHEERVYSWWCFPMVLFPFSIC